MPKKLLLINAILIAMAAGSALGRSLRGWSGLISVVVQRGRTQPWRCLWRGSAQMTMTRPWRRMTRHLLQIFLTLGLTFTGSALLVIQARRGTGQDRSRSEQTTDGSPSLVAVDDPPAGQVVRRKFHDDSVLRQDADVVLPHLAADVGQDLVSVGEFDPEHGVREWLDDATLDLDGTVFFGHILRYLTLLVTTFVATRAVHTVVRGR